MFEVLEGGFETTVQDYPGRIGHYGAGIPPSGPFDQIALRFGNLLVDNRPDQAGLEMTIIGPRLKCVSDTTIALTGADLSPALNKQPVPMWRSLKVKRDDVLSFGPCKSGCRAYLTMQGGIDAPVRNGSRSTYRLGSMGGLRGDGKILAPGDIIKTGDPNLSSSSSSEKNRAIKPDLLPTYTNRWEVRVIPGPHDDYYEKSSLDLFTRASYEFTISLQSNRVGVRLKGPSSYDYKPVDQRPASGEGHPSNIVLTNYPVGTVNMAGEEPIILGPDAVSFGGFCCIVTVISADMWKIGQGKPGDKIRFRAETPESARKIRLELEEMFTERALEIG